MKFTLSWLKEHLDTDADLDTITEKLTAIGLELEGIENPADALRDFRIAKVIEAVQHPNADKLRLLKVDDGSSDAPWQVVCGAPNAKTGLIGVFAPPGTYVPGAGFTLKPAKIRDVESFGMMCSAREMELGDEHDGIIALEPAAESAVGQSYPDYAHMDDPVIDVSVTPNKQDCMGVRGIARDLAAAGLGTLKPLQDAFKNTVRAEPVEALPFLAGAPLHKNSPSILRQAQYSGRTDWVERQGKGPDIRIEDHDGCPAFYGCTVSGVSNGASPQWMQSRLKAIGQKPISALVDITNYVMFDLGRPLHVYDMAKLSGPLVARKAKAGETLTALNGKDYVLDETMTVIADDKHAHDIGGIMGGEDSGAEDSTANVLIECAYFTPESIARTGQKLMLTSDARQRFERGVDPAFLDDGLEIATAYVLALCGGTASEVTRTGTAPTTPKIVHYDPSHTASLGGIEVQHDRQQDILQRLGFTIDARQTPWAITVPTWRRDVDGSADIVEEVVRITGLDHLPSTPLPRAPGVAKPTASPAQKMERQVRRAAAARGLNEAVNWSFISEKEDAALGGEPSPWVLANPISEDLKVMRTSLLPGLLSAAKRNRSRGAASIRLFEVGRRYFKDKDGASDERATLGIVLAGEAAPRNWESGKAQAFDPYAIKAEVMALLAAAGAPADKLMVFAPDGAGPDNFPGAHYHPGQAATLRLGPKKILASFGALHPKTAKAFGLKGAVMAAEIFLDAIPAKRSGSGRGGHMRQDYAPPALQDVMRDFAFVVDDTLPAEELLKSIRGSEKKHIVAARIFDVFRGDDVGPSKKSLAVEVTLRPSESSFTDEDLQAISDKVIAAAANKGGELRG